MAEKTVLVAPDGREYVAGTVSEVTRLKARGYKEKPAVKPVAKPVQKPAEKK